MRPFRRADRDQPADLVDLHVAAVAPGVFERGTGLELLPPARAADRLRLCGVGRLVARGGRRPHCAGSPDRRGLS
ncbi:hypothetical protein [Streptomyces sp. NPDC002788]